MFPNVTGICTTCLRKRGIGLQSTPLIKQFILHKDDGTHVSILFTLPKVNLTLIVSVVLRRIIIVVIYVTFKLTLATLNASRPWNTSSKPHRFQNIHFHINPTIVVFIAWEARQQCCQLLDSKTPSAFPSWWQKTPCTSPQVASKTFSFALSESYSRPKHYDGTWPWTVSMHWQSHIAAQWRTSLPWPLASVQVETGG